MFSREMKYQISNESKYFINFKLLLPSAYNNNNNNNYYNMNENSHLFLRAARPIIGSPPLTTAAVRFKSSLGVTVSVCVQVWNMIHPLFPTAHCHILWALYFMKTYVTEATAALLFGVSEKTFRQHVHITVQRIAALSTRVVSEKII